MKIGIIPPEDLTTDTLAASDYLDQDVTVRITGKAARWLRLKHQRELVHSLGATPMRVMVQRIVEQRMEEESGTGNDRKGAEGSQAD